MKKIKSKILNKLEAREKAKVRARMKVMREMNKKVDRINAVHALEMEQVMEQHEKVMVYKQRRHEKALASVREDERRNYVGPLEEANAEIKRLREYIEEQKRYYDSVKDREYLLTDTIKNVVDKFDRGINKANEAFQLMQFAFDDAEKFNKKHIKQDLKLIEEA